MEDFQSWGRIPKATQRVKTWHWLGDPIDFSGTGSTLAYGLGRSYGDSCLNDNQNLIATHRLNRFISFDDKSGILRCESGLSLAEILEFAVPRGWFIPVTPGTKFVTVGGAIANDVHGKNHHRAGTFGRHVRAFELLRSDSSRLHCSPNTNSELYQATIAGLGLTGLITWAEIQMRRVDSPAIDMESIKFENLDEFFELSAKSDADFEYTVSWLDCVSSGSSFGRGIFMRGNHAASGPNDDKLLHSRARLSVPVDFPGFVLNPITIKLFNTAYYHRLRQKVTRARVSFHPFFYPLDGVLHWNRIYGKRGFFQFQCVVPVDTSAQAPIRQILETIVKSGQGSFLAVIKNFGTMGSPGMMSFPRPGTTLALDFANRGQATLELFAKLDRIVLDAGGSIYPAKDALMPSASFKRYYSKWQEFSKFIDPKFSSSFWRRVMGLPRFEAVPNCPAI